MEYGKNMNIETTLVCGDTHFEAPLECGKKFVQPDLGHSPQAISVMLQIARDIEPSTIIHLGDLLEQGCASRWAEKVNRGGQVMGEDGHYYMTSWEKTVKYAVDFWSYIRKAFPKAKLVQLEGNHDLRIESAFLKPHMDPYRNTLSFRHLPVWASCAVTFHPYTGLSLTGSLPPWCDVGSVRVIHGYNASSKKMLDQHDNVMFGDSHRIDYNYNRERNSREKRRAWNIGCLCRLTPEFVSKGGRQAGWSHAFAVITSAEGKEFVEIVEIKEGFVAMYNRKVYRAKPLKAISPMLAELEV